jgi:metal-responsive CopG/Arc/MetJ family transcriptional regulator
MVRKDYTTISIPANLGKKIDEMTEGTGFTSRSDFVTFVLRELFIEENTANTSKDRENIREKLRALGYIE